MSVSWPDGPAPTSEDAAWSLILDGWCKRQHSNTRVYPGSGRGAVRPAGVREGAVLSCTGVLVVGGTSEAREVGKLPSLC